MREWGRGSKKVWDKRRVL